MKEPYKILLVEDDVNLGFVVKDNLEISGFEVTLCEDGELGYEAFLNQKFDVCILDIMLPRKDGISLAEEIRKQNDLVPIIFLSAKAMKEDKIMGFKAGADDYMTKPFSIEELILRIEVCLRRTRNMIQHSHSQNNTFQQTNKDLFQIGNYSFDYQNQSLAFGEEKRQLTQKEADILRIFCQNKGKVLKREEILNAIWGNDDYFIGRSLDVFISKLRKYLKKDSRIEIGNMHGVGFRLEIKTS